MNLQMIKQCLCLGYLYQLARQDCRWKKMDAGLVYGFLAAGIICFILEPFLNKAKGNRSMIITMSILFLSLLPGYRSIDPGGGWLWGWTFDTGNGILYGSLCVMEGCGNQSDLSDSLCFGTEIIAET